MLVATLKASQRGSYCWAAAGSAPGLGAGGIDHRPSVRSFPCVCLSEAHAGFTVPAEAGVEGPGRRWLWCECGRPILVSKAATGPVTPDAALQWSSGVPRACEALRWAPEPLLWN